METKFKFKLSISKETDLFLSSIPFIFFTSFFIVLCFSSKGLGLISVLLSIFSYFNGLNDSLLFIVNYYVYIPLFLLVFIVLSLLKMYKYKFYYIWLGVGLTSSTILLLSHNWSGFRIWFLENYLSNYIYLSDFSLNYRTYIKGLEVYFIIFIIGAISIYFYKSRKISINNLINFSFSSFFTLSIFQIDYYIYDLPGVVPAPENTAFGFFIYSLFLLFFVWLFLNETNSKNKLILWVSSYIVFSFIWSVVARYAYPPYLVLSIFSLYLIIVIVLSYKIKVFKKKIFLWIIALIVFYTAFSFFYTPVHYIPGLSFISNYFEYFFFRSDLVFFFILFCVLCFVENKRKSVN